MTTSAVAANTARPTRTAVQKAPASRTAPAARGRTQEELLKAGAAAPGGMKPAGQSFTRPGGQNVSAGAHSGRAGGSGGGARGGSRR